MEKNSTKSPEYSHLSGVERWLVFSSNPRTEEEIEEELLTRPDDVCLSYVCSTSKMSLPFIERLIVLSTGALNKDNVDKDFKAVEDLLKYKYTKTEDMEHKSVVLHRLGENNLPMVVDSKTLDERIDWKAITMYQKLNNDFILKYADFLDKQYILSTMLLHPDVEKALRDKMPSLGPKGKRLSSVDDVIDNQEKTPKFTEEQSQQERQKLFREKDFKEKEQSSLLKSFTETILALRSARKPITDINDAKKKDTEDEFDKVIEKKAKETKTTKKTSTKKKESSNAKEAVKSNTSKATKTTKKAPTKKKDVDDSKVVTMPNKSKAKKK